MAPSRSSLLRAVLGAALLIVCLPVTAAAHAELESAMPADRSTVEGTPDRIVLTFTEAIAQGSSVELRTVDGRILATARPDAASATTITLSPPELAPAVYTVRWTAVASDGHVERGTVAFTVVEIVAPSPSPTALATPSGGPSAEPSAVPSVTLAPSPTPAPSAAPTEPAGSGGDALIPIVAGLVLLGAFAAWLLRRRGGA